MGAVTRLRAYGGLWALVALLSTAIVFLAAAAGPASRQVADQALRQLVAEAPPSVRDIVVTEPTVAEPTTADLVHADVARAMAPELAGAMGDSWGAQRTQLRVGTPLHASVTGDGIAVSGPGGFMPLATLHHQTGLADAVRVVEGGAPQTPGTGSDPEPARPTVQVMVSEAVAEGLGLRVGQTYHLLARVAARSPMPPDQAPGPVVAVEVTGLFAPRDPVAPIWELDPHLLRHGIVQWPVSGDVAPLRRATFVTDQVGISHLVHLGLADQLGIQNVARFWVDPDRIDADWVDAGSAAVADLQTSPFLRASMRTETELIELLDEYTRQAAAARAVTAVAAAGVLGTGAGLLVLAARLTVERRRTELALMRSRGGSVARLVARLAAEAVLVVVPAAVAGWSLHLPLPGRPDPGVLAGVGAAPLAVAGFALLAVPAGVALAMHRGRSGARRASTRGRGGGGRRELRGYRSAPMRLTVESGVVVLAGVGVLLLHQRGLDRAGTDPYLSAVPVLFGLAAGLVALRLYPWPLRALGRLAARGRGVVGFVGLARAGRVAPAAALPLLVLVLAMAVGGFAAGTYTSVTAARDATAIRAVGADARVETEPFDPPAVVAAVAELPEVESVAAASDVGFLRVAGTRLQNTRVFSVDAVAYQEILAAVGTPGRLPDQVVTAQPEAGRVPILADPRTAGPDDEVTVEVAGVVHPARVAGELADLPALVGERDWVLVPREALPDPGEANHLLVAGAGADPAALRDAVVGTAGGDPEETSVTRLAEERAKLAGSGFNDGLTLVFLAGTAGAAAGGLLAVGLLLVAQATARGQALSLLRTMGLSAGQARGLLLLELLPVAGLAVVIGAVAGAAMPRLLAPALGLREFTGGARLSLGLDLGTVGVVAGLLGVFLVGAAMTEAAINRRLGLGHVLRVE